MSLRPFTVVFACLVIVASGAGLFAQNNQVFVTASFIDKRGLYIEDLDKQEVQIFQDNQPRAVEFMAREEAPTLYGILFDRTLLQYETVQMGPVRSVGSSNSAKDLAYELIDKYLGRQTVWVGAYDKAFDVVLDYSTDGFRAKDAIQSLPARRTAQEPFLYPALYSSIMRMKDRNEKRRVLIVFVYALDRETADKLKPLKNLLSSSNVELFFVSFVSRLDSASAMNSAMSQAILRELAQETSGLAFFATDYRDHLDDISRTIHNQLRTYYTFGFESRSASAAPSRLSVRCTRPGSKVKCRSNVPLLP